jgi:hypothetical protein
MLRRRGLNFSNADFQAILWYYEKNLYARLNYKAPKAKPSDYAQAAKKLVKRIRDERAETALKPAGPADA